MAEKFGKTLKTSDGVVVTVSRAEKSDLKEILALQYLAYQSEAELLNDYSIQPLKQTIEETENEFATSIFLKATDEQGKIIGSVRGRIIDESLFIGKLIVHPSMQGRGIGTALLNKIEMICDCKRCQLFTSSISIRNIALYQRAGYSIFKEEEFSDKFNFVYLHKSRALPLKAHLPAI